MDDLCKCGHEMIDHRDEVGCEDCMCDGFRWPEGFPQAPIDGTDPHGRYA